LDFKIAVKRAEMHEEEQILGGAGNICLEAGRNRKGNRR
jgi:hypothetical protein